MIHAESKPLTIERLSNLLEEDIVRRQLRVGDPYLTADEASKMLGVSRSKAHRAFQLLARRDLLVSKQRKGTFIGPAGPFKPPIEHELRNVQLLIAPARVRAGLSTGLLIDGLHDALPDCSLQLNYLPSENPRRFTEQVCQAENTVGLILIGCPRDVQECVAEQSIPALVIGSVYSTSEKIPSISLDNRRKGRILTEYLLGQGHRKIGLMMTSTWLPGDNLVYEGVNQVLTERGLPHGTLELRNLSLDEKLIRIELFRLLDLPEPPTGLICSQRIAETVLRSLGETANQTHAQVEVVVENSDFISPLGKQVVHIGPDMEFRKRIHAAGELLAELMRGNPLSEHRRTVGVHLVHPNASTSPSPTSTPPLSTSPTSTSPTSTSPSD